MESRPRLKIELTAIDRAFEITGWLVLIFTWCLVLVNYSDLPDTIPVHYNFSGKADGYGSKQTIFLLPFIAAVLYIGMTTLNKYPHVFNYLSEITIANALKQYTTSTKIIRYLKTIIVLIFALISFLTCSTAMGKTSGLGIWFSPMVMTLIIFPTIYFVVKSFRSAK